MLRSFGLALLLAACAKTAPEHPNVLLVTIDTLRADAIGEDTPAISDFLAEARRFRKARTVVPLTLPAHTSIFTGLFPASHGIHDNVTEPVPPRGERSFPLLAEQFKDAGYSTAAFVARTVLAPPTGIGSGFDVYDCPAVDGEAPEESYLPGTDRVDAAIKWIAQAPPGKPWFVWVHIFDPHAPYLLFPGDARRAATTASDSPRARYLGEVRRADAAIETLLRSVDPRTVVVLASDHGESLQEHGEPTHGPLCYGATVDAVLVVRAPGLARGTVDDGLRSVADVAPTLRRLCGLAAAGGEGRDLAGPPHETLVTESMFTWAIHGWGQVFGVTDGDFTLVESGTAVELFDRRSDPGETIPLGLSDPAYEKLDRALERFRQGRWGGGAGAEPLGSVVPYGQMRRQDKGYLSRSANALLANPRERLTDWAVLETVPPLIRICAIQRNPRRLEEMLRTLEDLQARNPLSPRIDHYRAKIHGAIADMTGRQGRFSHAAWAELAAIEKGYVQRETIGPAIAYAVAASDSTALRRLAELLRTSGKRLDPETGRALADARRRLPSQPEVFHDIGGR
ncbi:MAG TPA: sulfatase [Planctomycetota bacterium]|nr:sulfatase [Planctomycetota bacterium]